jgi:Ca2+-binding RTX toxin-like protein
MAVLYGTLNNDDQFGTNTADSIYGYDGSDYQYGYGGNDYLSGGNGIDYLIGHGDNDILDGGSNNDHLDGGTGQDYLYGGTGRDSLYGGLDYDTDRFIFSLGNSPSTTEGVDTVWDWNVLHDYIDLPIRGTASNYAEAPTSFTGIVGARHQVESNPTLRLEDHVFLYNTYTDTGYLLSDLDRNWSFESGIIIRGAGSALDMNYSDII